MNKDLATRLRAKEAALHDELGSQAPEYGKGLLDAADEAEKHYSDAGLRALVAKWRATVDLYEKDFKTTDPGQKSFAVANKYCADELEHALNGPAAVCDVAREPCEERRDWNERCWHMRETSNTNAEKLEFVWGKFEAAE